MIHPLLTHCLSFGEHFALQLPFKNIHELIYGKLHFGLQMLISEKSEDRPFSCKSALLGLYTNTFQFCRFICRSVASCSHPFNYSHALLRTELIFNRTVHNHITMQLSFRAWLLPPEISLFRFCHIFLRKTQSMF